MACLPCVLTINGGSSSIRFAVYEASTTLRRRLDGKIDRIGLRGTNLFVSDPAGTSKAPRRLAAADHRTAVRFLLDWLEGQPVFMSVRAVGHRVVHGMKHSKPERVTPRVLAMLRRITPYDSDHLRREIDLIEASLQRHPTLPQVACFDTAFHRAMPPVAKRLPIPRSYAAKGVERYGFHGLSYTYLTEELGRLDPAAARGPRHPRASRQRCQPGALELFCYQAKKWIGAFAAALGNLDTLVFAAGIGENAPVIRVRICHGLGVLDIALG